MTQRSKFVELAAKFADRQDDNMVYHEIVGAYNKIKPLPQGYKLKNSDAWCAATVSAIAWILDMTKVVYPECSCGRMIELYKKKGQWVENDAHIPQSGDIIMYDWQDNGRGDNTGWPDHVGIVEKVVGNKITVIEGNMSGGKVGRRTLEVNGRYIRGYCIPKFDGKLDKPVDHRAAVQKRFGFTDKTMRYLDGHSSPSDLYMKLATKK